ncbi:hypothetical protein JW968_00455 [Candidatus Woesearchaeota archaeon]|nr:hypothetical protein [Candidatus Woesearchaeota archaeon]
MVIPGILLVVLLVVLYAYYEHKNRGETMAFKHVVMTVAIAIMFALVVGFGIEAFYPSPEWEDYCGKEFPEPMKAIDESKCADMDRYYQECGEDIPKFTYDENGCRVFERCDTCNRDFREDNKKHSQIVFYMATILGLIGIIFGVYWRIDFMGSGVMIGGILLIIYGTIRYFGDMSRIMRFIVLLLEFLVLIGISYKKLVGKIQPAEKVKKKKK